MAEVFNMELRDGADGEEDISDDEVLATENQHQVNKGDNL